MSVSKPAGAGRRLVAVGCLLGLVALGCAAPADPVDEGMPPDFERVEGVATTEDYSADSGLEQWRAEVEGIEDVRIPSTADGAEQPALWLEPGDDGEQPLLVVLHSWSNGYDQHVGIPFAQWAQQRGWGMIHPDFRGVFETPEATGSDLAVQDVIDAIDFAAEQAEIDADRVYVTGFSGGGMMTLLMAGRHPDRFAGAAAWVPIHDLTDWFVYNRDEQPEEDYADQIIASCGAVPTADPEAAADCEQRSPETHLDAAREAGLPVYIGHGLADEVVPPDHSLDAFNQLVGPDAQLPPEAVAAAEQGELPADLEGSVEAEAHFGSQDPDVLLARQDGPVTLVLFDGEHEMAYHPGLAWMVDGPPSD